MRKTVLYYLAWVIILIGILITGFYLNHLYKDNWYVFGVGKVDIEKSGQFGDYIGGFVGTIVSVSGFIFLYLTLKEQREAFKKERFETKFYELLQMQRENVKEMAMFKDGTFSNMTLSGRDFIKEVVEYVLQSREEMKMFFRKKNENDIYEIDYSKKLKDRLRLTSPNVDLLKLAKVNIAYCIVYFGVDAEGKRALERLFRGKYKPSFYNPIINYMGLKPQKEHPYNSKWIELNQINPTITRMKIAAGILSRRRSNYDENIFSEKEKNQIENLWYRNEFEKYYSGFQTNLGHYFRHLFQIVKFVDREQYITKEEKRYFVKTLRAQLSTHEQVLLFINSLSFMGMAWELIPSVLWTDNIEQYDSHILRDTKLITNYRLIKNIPNENHFGFNIHDYYPSLKIEVSELDSSAQEKIRNISFRDRLKLSFNYYKKLRGSPKKHKL